VKAGKRDVDAKDALIVGLAQALAIFPGASRSGITMSAALARRIEPRKAFAFSFLLSVPAIICANAYELYRNLQVISYPVSYAIGYGSVLGILISFSVGYISLRILRRMIVERKLHYFAYYCWALGVALILSGF